MDTSFGKTWAAAGFAAATLLAGGPAQAAQWKTVRIAPEKTTYLDVKGMSRSGDAVQAWELEKFSADQASRAWEGKYRSVKSLTGYDCQKRTTEPLLRVYLAADGAELKRVQMQGLQFPAAVEPDSLREKMLELACMPKDKAEKAVVAKAEEKKTGLVPEAAAAELPKEAAAPAKPAEATGEKAKLEAGAADVKAEAKAKPDEKDKTADKAAEKQIVLPAKVALLARIQEAKTAHEASRSAAAASAKPARPAGTARVTLRRQRPKPAACTPVDTHKAAVACAANAARKPAAHETHWGYLGEAGSDRWGAISPAYAACAEGRQQSPIDIRDGARLDLEPIEFSYAPGPLRVVDNGHTIQVNIEAGRYIVVLGRRYDLKQFHFHKPAEERIDGRSYDMVAHLVHKDADGRIAVVAVLFEAGGENAFIRRLWPYLPLEPGIETYLPDVRVELDKLLPESRSYYTYMGSLTTPPCTEGVLWIVMKTPVPISAEQVAVFSRLYPMNARPIQQANGRFIKESM